jgi:ABC-type sugar transport system ATPase subunit
MSDPILAMAGISKSFAGVRALSDVSFALGRGRVLGVVGQNGAGKSTLMNVIGGVLRPDSGTMMLDGAPYTPQDPGHASRAGIAFIHQELNLFDNLSIAENIFIDRFPRRRFGPLRLIDRSALYRSTRALLERVDLDLSPETPIDRLSPGERQLVEVAKALQLDAAVIIFDEPTTSLTTRETERLFGLIERLRRNGKSMIYISHILGDVMHVADDLAVLRDGRLIASGPRKEFDIDRMITLMVGRAIEQLYPNRTSWPETDVLLAARSLGATGLVKDISLTLHGGEVLGVFGLMGSGRTELARILFGLDRFDAGEIEIGGRLVASASPRGSIARGLAFVTENRREEGLLMGMEIAGNVTLAALSNFGVTPLQFVDPARLRSEARIVADSLQIRAASITQPARSLSGGEPAEGRAGEVADDRAFGLHHG